MFNFILGLIVGGVIVKILDSRMRGNGSPQNPNFEEVKQKRENLVKVLEIAKARGEIGNDDVEQALRVSDATAERYLQELEKGEKLEQIGGTGQGVRYKLK